MQKDTRLHCINQEEKCVWINISRRGTSRPAGGIINTQQETLTIWPLYLEMTYSHHHGTNVRSFPIKYSNWPKSWWMVHVKPYKCTPIHMPQKKKKKNQLVSIPSSLSLFFWSEEHSIPKRSPFWLSPFSLLTSETRVPDSCHPQLPIHK